MKNVILVTILGLLFLSCTSNGETLINQEEGMSTSFFNIETGNKWVYKRYHYNNSTGEYSTTNKIDSVFVEGDTIINTLNYKKLYHYTYENIVNSPQIFILTKRFVKIDDNDHLVDPNGYVFHPGFDVNYTYTHDYYSPTYLDYNAGTNNQDLYGSANFQLVQNVLSLNVEGNLYELYNYQGDFTSAPDFNFPDNTINYMYADQIGAVLTRCPYLAGNGFYEDRLIYYELN